MKFIKSTIGEISAEIKTGKTPPTSIPEYFGNEIDWYTPGDLDKEKYLHESKRGITKKALEDKKAVVYKPNTILIGCIGDIGKLGITTGVSSSNQQLTGLLPDENRVTSEYLFYWLKRNKIVLEKASTSAIVPILNNKQLASIRISVPENLDDQIRIANILSKAEALINRRKEGLRLLDEFLKSTFLEMFGDTEENRKGFAIVELEYSCSDIVDCPHSTPVKSDSKTNFPCIRTSELDAGYIFWDSMQYLDETEYIKRTQRLIPKEGDIVYGREGTYGDAIRIPSDYKFSLGQRTMILRPDYSKCNSIFLWAMVRSDFVYRQAKKKNSGSTVGHVNVKDIRKFKLLCPPLKLQNHFAHIVEKTEAVKAHYQTSLQELENLYGSLSQRAFKGELKIQNAELIVPG